MYHYRVIEITNMEPVKIGAGGSKANTEPSKDYIPGSAIRGAVIGLLNRLKIFNDETGPAILLKMECYNAYPYRDSRLYMPTPAHLRVDKHKWREIKMKGGTEEARIEMTNLLDGYSNRTDDAAKNALEYRFVAIKNDRLRGIKVAKEYRLHHSAKRGNEEVRKENLFRYEAIAAGQTFRAIIKFDNSLCSLLEPVFKKIVRLYVGGSKGSGYGLCEIKPKGELLVSYQEAKRLAGISGEIDSQQGNTLTITCLSDCLLRDEYGQPINHIPARCIEEITGHSVLSEPETCVQIVQTGRTEGYNATWQARYPKETTLKAGSVLQYTLAEELDEDRLRQMAEALESRLIGQRTQDGYGWIGVNIRYPNKLLLKEGQTQQQKEQQGDSAVTDAGLERLLEEASANPSMSIILSGLEQARWRWLQMICVKSQFDSAEKLPSEESILISNGLKKNHLMRMKERLEAYLESLNNGGAIHNPGQPVRYYENDNQLCSIAKLNFSEILNYLQEKKAGSAEPLDRYAENMLNSKNGKFFYSRSIHPKKQFIAELLRTGLDIQQRRINE